MKNTEKTVTEKTPNRVNTKKRIRPKKTIKPPVQPAPSKPKDK
jgi:hypothetical protein